MTYAAVAAAVVSVVAGAAGTAVSMKSANDARNKQQAIARRAAEEADLLNNQREQLTQKFTKENFDPVQRDERFEQAAKTNETSLIDALTAAHNGGSTAGEVKSGAEGNLSSDYTRAAGAATASATEDMLKRARLMSRTNAPGLMYGEEALKGGQLASDIAGINSRINRTNSAANNAINGAADQGSLVGGLLVGAAPGIGAAAGSGVKGALGGATMTPRQGGPGWGFGIKTKLD